MKASKPTRYLLVAAVLAAAAAGSAFALTRATAKATHTAGTGAPPSLGSRFAMLSHAHSNQCGLAASALDGMAEGSRLQGSCCFPMNYGSYVKQIRGLRRYAKVAVVPKDPYDIPVSLARRLIAYQRIQLTADEQRTYHRAKPLSETKGPCCCPCWRWTAFGGQAKYLITQRNYSVKQIAEVWSLEEGCGGPSHT